MHFKNKSVGTMIPKLDLSKIKRDVEIEVESVEESNQQQQFNPDIFDYQDNLDNNEMNLEDDITFEYDHQSSSKETLELKELGIQKRKN